MTHNFWDVVKLRRSRYGFTGDRPVSAARMEEILRDTLLHLPSPYNSQSTRMVLLYDAHHKRFWDLTLRELMQAAPEKKHADIRRKIDEQFASGYATVLFFIDEKTVSELKSEFPKYAERFATWSEHSNAMHQYVLWAGMAAEGLGASLQHYSPLVDEAVHRQWGIPDHWRLTAQMPLGVPAEEPDEKEQQPLEERLIVYT